MYTSMGKAVATTKNVQQNRKGPIKVRELFVTRVTQMNGSPGRKVLYFVSCENAKAAITVKDTYHLRPETKDSGREKRSSLWPG